MEEIIEVSDYSLGDLIVGKIRAHNPDGWGPISDVNTGGVLA